MSASEAIGLVGLAGIEAHFLVRQGRQLRGTRFLRLTTRNCSSGECPEDDVPDGGVGAILARLIFSSSIPNSMRFRGRFGGWSRDSSQHCC